MKIWIDQPIIISNIYLKKIKPESGMENPFWLFAFQSLCPSVIVTLKVAMKKLQFWQV